MNIPGYKLADCGIDHSKGYDCPYEMEFDDMFEAFETPNRGYVGGQRTVDDMTPEGLTDMGGVKTSQRSEPGHKYP